MGQPDINKSKYDWCKEEFEKIEGREKLKDSFRERINSYNKLFEKLKIRIDSIRQYRD